MAARPNWRIIGLDLSMAEQFAREAERRHCQRVVADWNNRLQISKDPDPCPSIGVVLIGGFRFLHAFCPGCQTGKDVDLTKLDWNPAAKLTALIPKLSCRQCRGNAPFARLVRVSS